MPTNGEVSTTFGVYKTICCDFEIVISQGVKFPDCPKHPHMKTTWTSLEPATPKEPVDPAA